MERDILENMKDQEENVVTFRFKLLVYENGLGQIVVRAKWVNRFWFDRWVQSKEANRDYFSICGEPFEWDSREEAIEGKLGLRKMCEWMVGRMKVAERSKKIAKIRLITTEDLSIKISKQ